MLSAGQIVDLVRHSLFTGLEWVVLYHLRESFPRLRRIPKPAWLAFAAGLFVGNFWFRTIKRNFYPTPDDSALHALAFQLYVTFYYLVGVVAVIAGIVLCAHYGRRWWNARRARADLEGVEEPAAAPRYSRREFLSYGVAGGIGLTAGVASWSVATAANKDVAIRVVKVAVPPEHRHLVGLRIAQITDIHVGPFLRIAELERLMRVAQAQGADLIVHTGDHYNKEKEYAREGIDPMGELLAPHGKYIVAGNHDRYFGVEEFSRLFGEAGFRVLRLDGTGVPGVSGLKIWGINDPKEKFPAAFPEVDELAARIDSKDYNLLLSHRPEGFHEAARAGFDLTLAGHTHGGQVHLRGPLGLHFSPARLVLDYDWGLFEKPTENPERPSRLYVSSGLGFAGPPVRTFCPPEVAIIEFVPPGQGERPQVG